MLAAALGSLLADRQRARAMGRAGRLRVEAQFSWASVAAQTREVYAEAVADFARSSEKG